MAYKIAVGNNITDTGGNFTLLNPQPKSIGVRATRRTVSADGTVYEEGLYIELMYNVLDDATLYRTIIGQFGLTNVLKCPVTIICRDHLYNTGRYNGNAIRPEVGKDNNWSYFPKDITILVRDLVKLS